MDRDIVIEFNHVSKKFPKNLSVLMRYGITDIAKNTFGIDTHSETLRKNEFWAINDVSFKVKKGDSLGLIGPNGSGKSTILKMINGILTPDKGEIKIKGKVGALIEVGAGFHPMLTGRENIYVNGAILGMSKREIDLKFDEIIEFADIGDFLDTPVKTYSSGMFVRLGFAIAAHAETEVLLVDEVLAVGDISFQSKCYRKINQLRDKGVTFILVSHNLDSIRSNAVKALCLYNGKKILMGSPQKVCEEYIFYQTKKTNSDSLKETPLAGLQIPSSKNLKNLKFQLVNALGKPSSKVKSNEQISINFSFHYVGKSSNLQLGIIFYKEGLYLVGIDSLIDGLNLSVKDELVKGVLKIERLNLVPGQYTAVLAIINQGEFLLRGCPMNFSVVSKRIYPGFIELPHEWKIYKES